MTTARCLLLLSLSLPFASMAAAQSAEHTAPAATHAAPIRGPWHQLWDTETETPDQLMARISLHRDPSGGFDGYVIKRLPKSSALYRIGFRRGDVVHTVNDLPLTTVHEAQRALETLEGERYLTFHFTRGETNMTRHIELLTARTVSPATAP